MELREQIACAVRDWQESEPFPNTLLAADAILAIPEIRDALARASPRSLTVEEVRAWHATLPNSQP